MSANDVVLLQDMMERSRRETVGLTPSAQEAYFVAKTFLREFRPNHDDLLAGIVDGANDGGIDTLHIYANSHCVRDDTDLTALGRNVSLDVILTQTKNTSGFSEGAIDKLIANLPALLDFGRDESLLARRFNPRLIEITRRFLNAYRRLEMPSLNIYVAFASLRAEQVHPNTELKGELLMRVLTTCFGSCRPASISWTPPALPTWRATAHPCRRR